PRAHLISALVVAEAQAGAVLREIEYVHQALHGAGLELTLLKGAAYLLAGLPASKGRLFSDMDILTPHEQLPHVEATLMLSGWANTHHDPYDQRYYREWMHELPPMLHIKRMTVIDVHHAIVPTTADLKPSSAKLLAAAQPVAGWPGVKVLAPVDMVLHSATHLFYNEEFSHGLRDMSDLDLLLRHFSQQNDFWNALLTRADELGLGRPLYYCLHYCTQLFATPIPVAIMQSAKNAAPSGYLARLMDDLWLHVLNSLHPSAETSGMHANIAQQILYIRAHWHKMPFGLLAYHLLMKSLRPKSKTEEQS
ncbi:MAG TPA: nucleotidyltransferase family protein, partial [Rhodocyclaceae bacterium]|nr:nucleotidyltransferase family protein [Rhodocyclaceae bacterium]